MIMFRQIEINFCKIRAKNIILIYYKFQYKLKYIYRIFKAFTSFTKIVYPRGKNGFAEDLKI